MTELRSFPDWHRLYQEEQAERLPWYCPHLDPDLERALATWSIEPGKALDLGTGPATQALALAERGFDVTGSDLSAPAIERARALVQQEHPSIRFVQDDVLDSRIEEQFDLVFDRGCFHVLPPDRRPDYVRTARRLVAPRGFLFVKCFSHKEPRQGGPYRFSPDDIRGLFGAAFDVLSIDETVYQGTLDPYPLALFCALRPLV
jgi:SAM-dependent methyltransferase